MFSQYINYFYLIGKEHSHEILTKDDKFDYIAAFDRVLPTTIIYKTLGKSSIPVKEMKKYILNNLRSYSDHMQKCLYSVTQKHIGDCDKQIIDNLYKFMTKIIANPIANLFIGEVSN